MDGVQTSKPTELKGSFCFVLQFDMFIPAPKKAAWLDRVLERLKGI
jgi:hypothetical protein